MIKRILVTTDGSDLSLLALNRVRELAEDLPGTVVALHVIPDCPRDFPDAYHRQHLTRYHREQLRLRREGQRAVDEALAWLAGVRVQGVLRDACGRTIAEVIVREAADQAADLIVMSTHAHGRLSSLFARNTSGEVLRLARQPVLLVQSAPEPSPFPWWVRAPRVTPAS